MALIDVPFDFIDWFKQGGKWTDKDGQPREDTEWHKIVAWNGLAEIAEKFLSKGSEVCIEGKHTTRSWDKEDGSKAYISELKASYLKMLGGNKNNNDQN